MGESKLELKLSKARIKLTQLDKILKPGESLEVSKRDMPYTRIELQRGVDRYEQVLESIEASSEPLEELLPVAENHKILLSMPSHGS